MTRYDEGDVIDPVVDDLDPDTLKAVMHLIRGYSETSPSTPVSELSDYRMGKHRAYSAVMAVLSRWVEEIEEDVGGASSHRGYPEHGLDEERMNDLRDVLIPTNARLIQQILASSSGALSVVELAARNSISESSIRDHLRDLKDRDRPIVTSLDACESSVPRGIPERYYAVTKHGINLLRQAHLYHQIGALYDMYQSAELQLPDEESREVSLEDIEAYEHRPRPDWL